VQRPRPPEQTPILPDLLPRPKPQPDPMAELPKPRQKPKPNPPPQVARVEPQTAPPVPTVPRQTVETPAPTPAEPTQARREVASAAAVVPPAAIPRGAASDDVRRAYAGSLFRQINSVATRNYPRKSLQRREEGFVPVRLEVGQAGELLSVTVLDESQAPSRLISAALKAVRKSAPFPTFAPEMGAETATFEVRIQYKLR